MAESDLPPVPPTWRRLLRLPAAMVKEASWWATHRWRALRHRPLERWTSRLSFTPLRRVWWSTDPWYRLRAIEGFRGRCAEAAEQSATPLAIGMEPTVSGRLRPEPTEWGTLLLDGVPLDDAISTALGVQPGTPPFRANITVRVVRTRRPHLQPRPEPEPWPGCARCRGRPDWPRSA